MTTTLTEVKMNNLLFVWSFAGLLFLMNHEISIRWSTRFMMKLFPHPFDWDTTTWKKMILKQHLSRKRRKRLAIERSPCRCAIWRMNNRHIGTLCIYESSGKCWWLALDMQSKL
ncbi:unnamed protein product [Musa textilis]